MEKLKNVALISAAGSGKTHALTKRFLFLFLHKNDYPLKSLYAITFTNAAAFEMKSRILTYLDVLARGSFVKEQESDVWKYFKNLFTEDELKKIAQNKKEYLINNLSELNVSTFHSLFASFLSAVPFSAGILPDYRIVDEVEEDIILQEAIDKFFIEANQEKEKAISIIELIKDGKRGIKEFVGQFYRLLTPWIPYLRIMDRPELDDELKKGLDSLVRVLKEFINFVYKNVNATYTKQGKMNGHFEKFLTHIETFTEEPEIEKVEDVMNFFVKKDFLNKNYVLKFIDRLPDHKEFNDILERVKKEARKLLKLLSDKEIITHLRFIIELNNIFERRKREKNILTFQDIELYIQRAFENNPEMDYLYFKLGADINHLMIDEFQDTSFNQLKVLEPIIEEITSVVPEEKSLFYVGDPYQAIFRWRQGAPELFDYLRGKYKGKITEERLDINYRTKEKIIQFVNRVLNKNDQVKEENTGGWVRVENLGSFDYKEDGEEAVQKRVLEIIRELKEKGYVEKDIAVLTRTNEFAAELSILLNENGIACMSRSRASVVNECDFQFILHLLKFLENPEDDFSLFYVLTSEVFGIEEEKIRKLKGRKKTLFFSLNHFHPHWPATRLLNELLSLTYFANPYELVFQICRRLNLKISYPIATILDTALEFIERGIGSLSEFINHLEVYGPAIELKEVQFEGVNLLTIHKAKGLEYDVVIIPETHWDLQTSEHPHLLFSYSADNFTPERIYWRKWGAFFEELSEMEKSRLVHDTLNLLYVALTRARDGVYFLVFKNRKGNAGFWFDVIKEAIGEENLPVDEIPIKRPILREIKEEKIYTIKFAREFVIKEERDIYSPTERGIEIIEPARRRGIRFGEIVHNVLKRISWLDNFKVAEIIEDLVEYAKLNYAQTPSECEEIDKKLKNILIEILNDPDLHFIFYKEDKEKEYKNEVDIYFDDGKNDVSIQIDRLIIESELVTVIDYKTGTEKLEYRHQLEVYKKGLELIYPKKSIQTFIVYLENPPGERLVRV